MLFQFVIAIVNDYAVVMPVESMDECIDAGLVQMSNVGGGFLWLLSQHHKLCIDKSEAVDDHLALHRLYGVHH